MEIWIPHVQFFFGKNDSTREVYRMIHELVRIYFVMQLAAPCTVAGPPLDILYPSRQKCTFFSSLTKAELQIRVFYRFIAGF